MSEGERLAIYWRCYLCRCLYELIEPADIGHYCCRQCGMICLLPTYGPLFAEDDADPGT